MGGEELKCCQLAQYNEPIRVSGKLVTTGISDVVTASVYSEKIRLKKLVMIIIIIMNKSQETMVFHGRQKLTSAMKVQKSDGFDTLYR